MKLICLIFFVALYVGYVQGACKSEYCQCSQGGGSICKDPERPERPICDKEFDDYIILMSCSTHPQRCCSDCPGLKTEVRTEASCEEEEPILDCAEYVCCKKFDAAQCERIVMLYTLGKCDCPTD